MRLRLLVTLWIAMCAASVQAGEDVHFERLTNGCRLHLERVEGCGELGLFVFIEGGWALDPLDGTGTAHLLEHLVMTGATPEREGWSYQRWNQERSAANAMTSCRYTAYFSIGDRKAISSDARRWAEVLAGKLSFGLRDLGRERPRALMEARNVTKLYPGPMLQWRARERLLAGTPEGRIGVGVLDALAKVDEEALRAMYRRTHHVANALIVAVGHVDPEQDLPFYRELFGSLARPEGEAGPVPALPAARDAVPARWKVVQVKAPFATLAFAAPPRDDAEYPAFVAAAMVLGQRALRSFPRSDSLGQAMFFPGYYAPLEMPEIAFFNWRGPDGSELTAAEEALGAWMHKQHTRAVGGTELQQVRQQLRQLLDPLPRERARAAQLARFPRLLYSVGIARGVTRLGVLPEDLWTKVAALEPSEVAAAATKFFAVERGELLGLAPSLPELREELERKAKERRESADDEPREPPNEAQRKDGEPRELPNEEQRKDGEPRELPKEEQRKEAEAEQIDPPKAERAR